MQIDWKRKLSSRKFWTMLAGFITPLVISKGGSAELATEVACIIMSGAAAIAYMIGEGLSDCGNNKEGDGDGS